MAFIASMLLSLVFSNVNVGPAQIQTTLYIDPPSVTVPVSSNFTVNINVADVVDLFAWQAWLTFDPSLMEIIGYAPGPFLPPPTVNPPPIIDNVAGYILAGDSRISPPGASGSGTLAKITFHCKAPGSGLLHFDMANTFLLDSDLMLIPYQAIDGVVTQISPKKGLHGEDGLFYNVHLHADFLINLMKPISTKWHELWPYYSRRYHLTSWEDNGDKFLSPSDQIDMVPLEFTAEQWDEFWGKGDVNKDGYIDEKDIAIIQEEFGWHGPPGENPADINKDGVVDILDAIICAANQGLDIWTYFKTWWHVDSVTVTIVVKEKNVSQPIPIYLELLADFPYGYKEALVNPKTTYWHEIYPVYSRYFHLSSWVDNGDKMLSASDQIDMTDEQGNVKWYHVEQVSTDITVTRKPISTQWHEIYPEFSSHDYHLTSWIDNGDHILSWSDKIDMTDKKTGEVSWWHVTQVTTTIVVTEKKTPPPEPMYLEMTMEYGSQAISAMQWPITYPVSTVWHEIWPVFSRYYHLSSWEDNGDGFLSVSDQIDMTDEYGKLHWYHVEDVSIDIWIEPCPRVKWNRKFAIIDYFMTFVPSPAVANLDTTTPGLEIVTGTDEWYGNQKWWAFTAAGGVLWTLPTRVDESRTSVAIADIDGDGDLEMAGGTTSGWETQVFDHTGNFVWRYSEPGVYDWWHSSPAISNVVPTSPGLEIIAAEYFGHKIFVFSNTGSVLWSYTIPEGGIIDASPAVGDIDNDGSLEIVIGTAPPAGQPHKVYAFNGATGAVKWAHQVQAPSTCSNRAVHSSAALADVDGDGIIEVIFGANDGGVRALKGTDGTLKWTYWTFGSVYSSPAVGDVDNDGALEIIVGSNDGRVYALNGAGGLEWFYQTGGAVVSSPALANRGTTPGLGIYVGSMDKKLYLLDGWGNLIWAFDTGATNGITSSPVVADIDGDTHLEVMFTDSNAIPDNAAVTNVFWVLWDCTSRVEPYAIEWPMFRHDRSHTGKYSPGGEGLGQAASATHSSSTQSGSAEILSPDPHDVAIVFDWLSKFLVTAGETIEVYVDVQNQGDFEETTTVTVSYNGNPLGSQPVTLAPGETQTLTFPWDTTGVPEGFYAVTAVASSVPGETDLIDNTFSTMVMIKEAVHDIAVANVNGFPSVVFQGYKAPIDITLFNQGDYSETFIVTAAYGSTPIEPAALVTMNPSDSAVEMLLWNTAGVPLGSYTISGYLTTPIPGEIDIADNEFLGSSIMISKPGDLNLDGVVNYKDASLFRQAYIIAYHYLADFNQDSAVNYRDAGLFRGYYIAG